VGGDAGILQGDFRPGDEVTRFSPQAIGGIVSDKEGTIAGTRFERDQHTRASQRSDTMKLPKWARWAGLGLCAAMLPAMAVAAKPTAHKSNKTSKTATTSSHHANASKASKMSSKKASTKKLHASSNKAHSQKLSATHKSKRSHATTKSQATKSHTSLSHKHSTQKASKLTTTKSKR
jgi:hypothetical protein